MIEFIDNNKKIPFLKFVVKNHLDIKPLILNNIEKMGEYGAKNNFQSISNCDYYLPGNYLRYYFENISDIFKDVAESINNLYNLETKLNVGAYWFQQYKTNDFHNWHIHPNCMFSCVYYVNVENDTPKTTFQFFDKSELELKMNEGEILIFPAYLKHMSKANKSLKTKTIISFNIT